jgi:DHA3 family macrolide efflux protein-like MFS transporter
MSRWGTPRRKIQGILGFACLLALGLFFSGLKPIAWVWSIGAVLIFFSLPNISGSVHALLMSKIEPQVQGRVFSVQRMMDLATPAIAYTFAGPLAEKVFEPLLQPDGALAGTVGRLVGVGPGRGMGLLMICMGFILLGLVGVAYLYSPLRNIEEELPDVV